MEPPRVSRRRVVVASCAGVAGVLAGCTEGTRSDPEPAGDDSEGQPSTDDGQAGDGSFAGDEEPSEDNTADVAEEAPEDAAAVVAVGPAQQTVFQPQDVQVALGETVAWVWDSDGHTVTPTDQPADATWQGEQEVSEEGHVHEHTFEAEGTYAYECEPHAEAGMRGSVTVGGQ